MCRVSLPQVGDVYGCTLPAGLLLFCLEASAKDPVFDVTVFPPCSMLHAPCSPPWLQVLELDDGLEDKLEELSPFRY